MRLLKSITAGLTLAALPASTGLFAQTTDFTPTAPSMTMALTGDSIIGLYGPPRTVTATLGLKF